MPLYEYECDKCGHRFERIQKFSDPLVETCPTCGGAVHKLMSSPAIQFKGSGWYITDYAKKDNVTATKAGESGGTSKDGEGESKAQTKSEATTEAAKSDSKSDAPATPASSPAKE